MTAKRARRSDWRNSSIPTEKENIDFKESYSAQEYKKIKIGYIPDELEDPWFMYVEDDCLYIHPNDGIGRCVYQVRFKQIDGHYQAVDTWASRSKRRPLPSDDKSLVSFADTYNKSKTQGDFQHLSAILAEHPVSTKEKRTAAIKDISILQYLIDHWLIKRPWK